jgi:hypothetical protein
MRAGLTLAAVLIATTATAEPNYSRQLHDWLWPQKPVASPTVPVTVLPLPDIQLTPFVEPVAAPQATWPEPVVLPRPKPRIVERQPKRHVAKPRPKVDGITCAQARQGVGMPCFLIRANAYQYEQLSPAEKAKANSCLTVAEREAIRACFR